MKQPSPAVRSTTAASETCVVYGALTTTFSVRSVSPSVLETVDLQYGRLRKLETRSEGNVDIELKSVGDSVEIVIDRKQVACVTGQGHLLHELDNRLAYELQRRVPQFYFVHSACLAKDGLATMIMGDSGAGKSTTAYGLAAAGLEYLSDELSPVDVESHLVLPYPRAICLKNDPPAPLELPDEYLRSEWTLHVDPCRLGASIANEPRQLERIVFLTHEPGTEAPRLKRLSSSEAALRLYQNALNQLAHESWGLDDTVRLVSAATCYELVRGGVSETLAALAETGAV